MSKARRRHNKSKPEQPQAVVPSTTVSPAPVVMPMVPYNGQGMGYPMSMMPQVGQPISHYSMIQIPHTMRFGHSPEEDRMLLASMFQSVGIPGVYSPYHHGHFSGYFSPGMVPMFMPMVQTPIDLFLDAQRQLVELVQTISASEKDNHTDTKWADRLFLAVINVLSRFEVLDQAIKEQYYIQEKIENPLMSYLYNALSTGVKHANLMDEKTLAQMKEAWRLVKLFASTSKIYIESKLPVGFLPVIIDRHEGGQEALPGWKQFVLTELEPLILQLYPFEENEISSFLDLLQSVKQTFLLKPTISEKPICDRIDFYIGYHELTMLFGQMYFKSSAEYPCAKAIVEFLESVPDQQRDNTLKTINELLSIEITSEIFTHEDAHDILMQIIWDGVRQLSKEGDRVKLWSEKVASVSADIIPSDSSLRSYEALTPVVDYSADSADAEALLAEYIRVLSQFSALSPDDKQAIRCDSKPLEITDHHHIVNAMASILLHIVNRFHIPELDKDEQGAEEALRKWLLLEQGIKAYGHLMKHGNEFRLAILAEQVLGIVLSDYIRKETQPSTEVRSAIAERLKHIFRFSVWEDADLLDKKSQKYNDTFNLFWKEDLLALGEMQYRLARSMTIALRRNPQLGMVVLSVCDKALGTYQRLLGYGQKGAAVDDIWFESHLNKLIVYCESAHYEEAKTVAELIKQNLESVERYIPLQRAEYLVRLASKWGYYIPVHKEFASEIRCVIEQAKQVLADNKDMEFPEHVRFGIHYIKMLSHYHLREFDKVGACLDDIAKRMPNLSPKYCVVVMSFTMRLRYSEIYDIQSGHEKKKELESFDQLMMILRPFEHHATQLVECFLGEDVDHEAKQQAQRAMATVLQIEEIERKLVSDIVSQIKARYAEEANPLEAFCKDIKQVSDELLPKEHDLRTQPVPKLYGFLELIQDLTIDKKGDRTFEDEIFEININEVYVTVAMQRNKLMGYLQHGDQVQQSRHFDPRDPAQCFFNKGFLHVPYKDQYLQWIDELLAVEDVLLQYLQSQDYYGIAFTLGLDPFTVNKVTYRSEERTTFVVKLGVLLKRQQEFKNNFQAYAKAWVKSKAQEQQEVLRLKHENEQREKDFESNQKEWLRSVLSDLNEIENKTRVKRGLNPDKFTSPKPESKAKRRKTKASKKAPAVASSRASSEASSSSSTGTSWVSKTSDVPTVVADDVIYECALSDAIKKACRAMREQQFTTALNSFNSLLITLDFCQVKQIYKERAKLHICLGIIEAQLFCHSDSNLSEKIKGLQLAMAHVPTVKALLSKKEHAAFKPAYRFVIESAQEQLALLQARNNAYIDNLKQSRRQAIYRRGEEALSIRSYTEGVQVLAQEKSQRVVQTTLRGNGEEEIRRIGELSLVQTILKQQPGRVITDAQKRELINKLGMEAWKSNAAPKCKEANALKDTQEQLSQINTMLETIQPLVAIVTELGQERQAVKESQTR